MDEKEYEKLKDFIETQEKKHYQSLRDLFKWIVASLTIIFTAGAAIVGANIYQINENVKNELREAKSEVATLKSESNSFLLSVEKRSNFQVELIEKEAKLNALAAIKLNIEEELQSPVIQQHLYSELRKNINNNLDVLAEESFGKATKDFKKSTRQISELNTAFHYAYWNDISKVKYIDSISYYSRDKDIRDIACDFLNKLSTAYIGWYGFEKNTNYSIQYRELDKIASGLNDIELRDYLLKKILSEKDSGLLTKEFQAYLNLIEGDIKLLEFHKLKKE